VRYRPYRRPGSDPLVFGAMLDGIASRGEAREVLCDDRRLPDIREAIRISELTEYGDVINARPGNRCPPFGAAV
jgi:hypothetical protein